MEVKIEESWKSHLSPEFEKSYFGDLTSFVRKAYTTSTVYPPPANIFKAFDLCPFEKVEVVILGQDPYHGPRQANGLCFSVSDGVALPPSLINIYKEISNDCGIPFEELARSGDLSRWAKQGVLLLNATLTVKAHTAGSHQGKGWEEFTDAAIAALSSQRKHLVFMLWGNYAKRKGEHIDRTKHLVLESAHPSPLSAYNGFFGNKHFSKANTYLTSYSKKPIDWR
jgi:uracil-DNA glycosylase